MTGLPQDPDPPPKPRGLWSVISQSSESKPSDQESGPEPDEHDPVVDEPTTASPRSLFTVMQRAETSASQEQVDDVDHSRALASDIGTPTTAAHEPDSLPSNDEPVGHLIEPIGAVSDRRIFSLKQARNRVRMNQGSIALSCGMASIALSALAIRPEFWMSFPASAAGFVAIFLGFMTLTGRRLRDLSPRTKIASQTGMLLGTLGIFLGPVIFAPLGRGFRDSSGPTRKHLIEIGVGLDRYHDQHGAFPIGGTIVRDKSGAMRGQHGWMTFLLPYIGEQQLYDQIDQTKPFDAVENRRAVGHDVEAYFAAGGDRSKIGQGFAVAHFAGVGGNVDDDSRVLHEGIFAQNVAIKRSDVTDGLANTLIVGELAASYPAWSDPENWRTIGKGLNKDANGFGNAAGTGAMFLLGDGSVRLFSNKTSPRLLKQLSTRDGGEVTP